MKQTELDKIIACKEFLPEPGPEVVGKLADELKSLYQTLGRVAELSDRVCSWISGQAEVPKYVAVAATEIMDYVENVRP